MYLIDKLSEEDRHGLRAALENFQLERRQLRPIKTPEPLRNLELPPKRKGKRK